MSDTPRTDEVERAHGLAWFGLRDETGRAQDAATKFREIARTLERELAAARMALDAINEASNVREGHGTGGSRPIPRDVFDALIDWTGAEPSQSVLALAVDAWSERCGDGCQGCPKCWSRDSTTPAETANPVSRAGRSLKDIDFERENVHAPGNVDTARGLILNVLAGHRVDQFPPEKQMLEECLRLLHEPPGVGRDYKALYEELLYAVGNKYEGESRHETALRYIRRDEEPSVTGSDQAAKSVNAAGDSR